WSGTFTTVTGANWNVLLGPQQARLFRLISTQPWPTNLTATLNGDNVILSWPVDHTGWRLQTGATLTTFGAGWSDLIGTRQTNVWRVPINPSGGSVFFRLAWP